MDEHQLYEEATAYADNLDGEEYGRGRLEELQATCDNLRLVVGMLIVLLINKEVIDRSIVDYLIDTQCS